MKSAMWKIRIPPRVRLFLWRVCRKCLPMRTNLKNKAMDYELHCDHCLDALDKQCWMEVNLWPLIQPFLDNAYSFEDACFKSPYQLNLLWFCGVFGRPETNKQWNDTGPNIYLTVSRAIQVLHKWINARNLQQPESTSLNNEDFAWWEPPPSGFLKYIGINYKLGGFVSEMPMVCFLQILEGEALSLLHVMKWAIKLGYTRVYFEVDCKGVQDMIHSSKCNTT
ncbi:hypothetical protein HKD37_02G005139 [Glycine soja]